MNSQGTSVNGIEQYADKIVSRGILLDIPRYRGVDWLEPGDGISADDLAGACKAVGLEPEARRHRQRAHRGDGDGARHRHVGHLRRR